MRKAKKTSGEIVREKRESLGVKLRPFATVLGVAATTLSRIERNEIIPGVDVATRIARELGLSFAEKQVLVSHWGAGAREKWDAWQAML